LSKFFAKAAKETRKALDWKKSGSFTCFQWKVIQQRKDINVLKEAKGSPIHYSITSKESNWTLFSASPPTFYRIVFLRSRARAAERLFEYIFSNFFVQLFFSSTRIMAHVFVSPQPEWLMLGEITSTSRLYQGCQMVSFQT
jgi:hypothetical protein